MELLTGIFTAFGLSATAGLNAYIPLLIVGLLGHYTQPDAAQLPVGHAVQSLDYFMLCILVIIEMLADKIPAVNHINDADPDVYPAGCGCCGFRRQCACRDTCQPGSGTGLWTCSSPGPCMSPRRERSVPP